MSSRPSQLRQESSRTKQRISALSFSSLQQTRRAPLARRRKSNQRLLTPKILARGSLRQRGNPRTETYSGGGSGARSRRQSRGRSQRGRGSHHAYTGAFSSSHWFWLSATTRWLRRFCHHAVDVFYRPLPGQAGNVSQLPRHSICQASPPPRTTTAGERKRAPRKPCAVAFQERGHTRTQPLLSRRPCSTGRRTTRNGLAWLGSRHHDGVPSCLPAAAATLRSSNVASSCAA